MAGEADADNTVFAPGTYSPPNSPGGVTPERESSVIRSHDQLSPDRNVPLKADTLLT